MDRTEKASPRTILLSAALILFALASCGEDEKVTAIAAEAETGWRLIGPFAVTDLTGFEDGLDRDYLAEANGPGKGGEKEETTAALFRPLGAGTWKEAGGGLVESEGYSGIDFLREFGRTSYAAAYAYREVESPVRRRVELKVGSDDGIKIWLNGEVVLSRHVRRALIAGEEAALVTLQEGTNRLLVKVEQSEGEWGFLLKLDTPAEGGDKGTVESLRACPDSHAAPAGSCIDGTLLAVPSGCPDGAARIELVDRRGEILATTEARIGERFAVPSPAGFSGPAVLRTFGLGPFASAESEPEILIIGNAAGLAESAAASARAAAATAVSASADADTAATLEFLALSVEGKLPAPLSGYDKAAAALVQIERMTRAGEAGGGVLEGLCRYAYVSSLDGSIQPYSLYVPAGYDPAESYGLVVTLHGATGNDYDQASALASAAPPDLLIVAPFGRGDLSYVGAGERDVIDVIDLVRSKYRVDGDRVYLTGSSMGGYGTWRLAQLYPRLFAAIAPFAGWTGIELLENIAGLPVLAVHGDRDDVVPCAQDEKAIRILSAIGGNAELDLLPGVGHPAFAAWTKADGSGRLLDWFRRFKRVAWPAAVKIRTTMASKGAARWASVLGMQDGRETAGLDARILDARHISVETENVSAFELDLRHPGLARGGRVLILADGFNVTADSGKASARFELGAEGRFLAVPEEAAGGSPNTGAGIAALFDGPIRVIYGTQRRAAAAHNESIARALGAAFDGILSVEAVRDRESGAIDPAGNYSRLFVGNPSDCPPLARVLPALPLSWEKGRYRLRDADGRSSEAEGILLVYPDPERPPHIMGLLTLPAKSSAAESFSSILAAPLRSGRPNDPCGYKLPDLMFIDAEGSPTSAAFFDWKWEDLVVFPSS